MPKKITIQTEYDSAFPSIASALKSGGFKATVALFSKDSDHLEIEGTIGGIPCTIGISCADIDVVSRIMIAFGFTLAMRNIMATDGLEFRKPPDSL